MLEGALDRVSMGIAFARKSGEVMYANECARRFLDTYSLAARPPSPWIKSGTTCCGEVCLGSFATWIARDKSGPPQTDVC